MKKKITKEQVKENLKAFRKELKDRGEVDGGMEKVFRSLQRLKKGTRFSDEDIARFDFKE